MLILHKPTLEELSFRQELLADEATMSYNHSYGGCIAFPPEKWETWYEKWLKTDTNRYFYRYLYNEELKTFVGECAYHWNEEEQKHICNVIVHSRYRGKGYGKEALLLLCEAAKDNGLTELWDSIAIDNASIGLFLHCGFVEASRDAEVVWLKKEW